MKNIDGSLIGDLNDDEFTKYVTSSVFGLYPTSSINENNTVYDLFPAILNRPPIITNAISEASLPKIKNISMADATGTYLYSDEERVIKVLKGVTFTLRLDAIQPNTLNIENGIPKVILPNEKLEFTWKHNDNKITSTEIPSLQSAITIENNTIRFQKIQPTQAGIYTCTVTNDIGSTESGQITLEVQNPDRDNMFYRNLVKNGNATNGVEDWESATGDLLAFKLNTKPAEKLIEPHKAKLFGYNTEHMHPKPYQLDVGVVKDINYEKDFVVGGGGGYFTRGIYKLEEAGGKSYVKFYQDIDVSSIQDMIKGGVYGIDGVRAVFGCYIGNALSYYIPTLPLMATKAGTSDPKNYYQGAPRISAENFLKAGPGKPIGQAYVTVEEYNKEAKLQSKVLDGSGNIQVVNRVALQDPWKKQLDKQWGIARNYYEEDLYLIGEKSKGNWLDKVLFAADELYPQRYIRPAHGQYLEFNRVVLDRLNPNTTKVRITLNYGIDDMRIWATHENEEFGLEDMPEFIAWETNWPKNKFEPQSVNNNTIKWLRSLETNGYKDVSIKTIRKAPAPRVAITGLSLSLLPIEKQNQQTTQYYTSTTLNENNRPAEKINTPLEEGIVYDPTGKLTRNLYIQFQHRGSFTLEEPERFRTSIALYEQIADIDGKSGGLIMPGPLTALSSKKDNGKHIVIPLQQDSSIKVYGISPENQASQMDSVNETVPAYAKVVSSIPHKALWTQKNSNASPIDMPEELPEDLQAKIDSSVTAYMDFASTLYNTLERNSTVFCSLTHPLILHSGYSTKEGKQFNLAPYKDYTAIPTNAINANIVIQASKPHDSKWTIIDEPSSTILLGIDKNKIFPGTAPQSTLVAQWAGRFRYILHYMSRNSADQSTVTKTYYLDINTNPKTQQASGIDIRLYSDTTMQNSIPAEFEVKDYRINDMENFEFDLPIELLSAPADEGGLGIPLITNFTANYNGAATLAVLMNAPHMVTQDIIDKYFDLALAAINISTSAAIQQYRFAHREIVAIEEKNTIIKVWSDQKFSAISLINNIKETIMLVQEKLNDVKRWLGNVIQGAFDQIKDWIIRKLREIDFDYKIAGTHPIRFLGDITVGGRSLRSWQTYFDQRDDQYERDLAEKERLEREEEANAAMATLNMEKNIDQINKDKEAFKETFTEDLNNLLYGGGTLTVKDFHEDYQFDKIESTDIEIPYPILDPRYETILYAMTLAPQDDAIIADGSPMRGRSTNGRMSYTCKYLPVENIGKGPLRSLPQLPANTYKVFTQPANVTNFIKAIKAPLLADAAKEEFYAALLLKNMKQS